VAPARLTRAPSRASDCRGHLGPNARRGARRHSRSRPHLAGEHASARPWPGCPPLGQPLPAGRATSNPVSLTVSSAPTSRLTGVERAVDEHGLWAAEGYRRSRAGAAHARRAATSWRIRSARLRPLEGLQHQEGAAVRRAVAVVHDGRLGDRATARVTASSSRRRTNREAPCRRAEATVTSAPTPRRGAGLACPMDPRQAARHLTPSLDHLADPGSLLASARKEIPGFPCGRDGSCGLKRFRYLVWQA
jgi:hypothetical protein